ncbi:MAG: tRNA (adenosine(37)-N6)-threonylcarbamoyltransferase complex ATPase subunit type 1 TsaE [Deltaproteobacteria bacterium]|nr:tRNA (adenosine(37)-N6)-threonylcarbamoyltransferase complex ATPase subunit type 1 TsaE [Deltaproteobacteria bacterium]
MEPGLYRSGSPEETEGLGEMLAARLKKGDTIALIGELGSGKTRFVRGVARGLGAKGRIKSPSFTIINIYGHGRLPLYHIDLYRIGREDEFFSAGLEEYIYGDGVSIIEWADRLPGLVHGCGVIVRFSHKGENARDIEVELKKKTRRENR